MKLQEQGRYVRDIPADVEGRVRLQLDGMRYIQTRSTRYTLTVVRAAATVQRSSTRGTIVLPTT